MTKFQLSNTNGGLDYPTLGFTATADGAILDGTLSDPVLTVPPDSRWSVYGGGSAETNITRYAAGTVTPTPEVADGWVLAYSDAANTYVPTDLSASYEPIAQDTGWRDISDINAWGFDPETILVRRIGDTVTLCCNSAANTFDANDLSGKQLPTGFRPFGYGTTASVLLTCGDDSGGFTGHLTIQTNGVMGSGALVGTFQIILDCFRAEDAWPSPLPGDPVP